jgi:signal transduction histidine kinase
MRDDGRDSARERQRIARDLHDEFTSLALLKLELEMTAGYIEQGRTREASRRLGEAQALLAETIKSVRRVVLDLGPAVIDEVGLPRAIRRATRQFAARTGIKVRLRGSAVPALLPPVYQVTVYRVLQGALSNVLRHSGAASAAVTLAAAPGPALVMSIKDDGVGFPPRGRAARLSFGLAAMRERTEALGGRFRVESWPARAGRRRRGTRIEVSLPFPAGPRT